MYEKESFGRTKQKRNEKEDNKSKKLTVTTSKEGNQTTRTTICSLISTTKNIDSTTTLNVAATNAVHRTAPLPTETILSTKTLPTTKTLLPTTTLPTATILTTITLLPTTKVTTPPTTTILLLPTTTQAKRQTTGILSPTTRAPKPTTKTFNLLFLLRKLSSQLLLLLLMLFTFSDCNTAYAADGAEVRMVVKGRTTTTTIIAGQHARHINVLVTQHNTTTTLDLFLNTALLSSTFVEKVISHNATYYRHSKQSQEFCYYVGTVRGESDSSAAFSTCPSLRGFWRVAEKTWRLADLQEGAYQILLESNNNIAAWFKGINELQDKVGSLRSDQVNRHQLRRRRAVVQDYFEDMLVMELYLANDVTRYEEAGTEAVFRSCKEVANVANMLYQPLGMMVVLVGVEVWKDRNKIQVSKDSAVTLNNWMAYRGSQVPLYNDVGFFLSRTKYEHSTLGLAHIGTMCSTGQSGGIMQSIDGRTDVSGAILAHEIGHNFGFTHDSESCVCESEFVDCIMSSRASTSRAGRYFSSCSKDQLRRSFAKGSDICLHNSPHSLKLYLAVCGNGILEEGEQCDCGRMPSHMCNQKCCDSDTCRLKGKCAQGACCDVDSCSLRGQGHVCRAERAGSCDLAESCDGSTSSCPTDIFVHDATACTAHNKEASCFGGVCQSRASQCKLLYGEDATDGLDDCYNYNTQGSSDGHCGYNLKFETSRSIEYLPCSVGNQFCGSLQCQSASQNLSKHYKYLSKSNKRLRDSACNSIIFDLGKQVIDPGIVPNGSPCGSDRVCVDKKCLDRFSLLPKSCFACINAKCNSKGVCQCSSGYSGPSCEQTSGLIVGLVIFFLILIILIALLIYDYKHKQHFINYFKSLASKFQKMERVPVKQSRMSTMKPSKSNKNFKQDDRSTSKNEFDNSIIPTRTAPKCPQLKPLPATPLEYTNHADYNLNIKQKWKTDANVWQDTEVCPSNVHPVEKHNKKYPHNPFKHTAHPLNDNKPANNLDSNISNNKISKQFININEQSTEHKSSNKPNFPPKPVHPKNKPPRPTNPPVLQHSDHQVVLRFDELNNNKRFLNQKNKNRDSIV